MGENVTRTRWKVKDAYILEKGRKCKRLNINHKLLVDYFSRKVKLRLL